MRRAAGHNRASAGCLGGAKLALYPLLLLVSIVVVIGDTPRFRAPLDPFVILLAALAASGGWERAARAVRSWCGGWSRSA